jgi:hypothetical protein
MKKVTLRRRRIEAKMTEETVEDICESFVPLLKRA